MKLRIAIISAVSHVVTAFDILIPILYFPIFYTFLVGSWVILESIFQKTFGYLLHMGSFKLVSVQPSK